ELQVVTGVPPAAGRVDPSPQRAEVAAEATGAGVVARREVGHRALIVQVPRRGAECRRDERGTVALYLEEAQRVRQRSRVHAASRIDPKRWGGRGDRTGDADRVRAGGGLRRNVDRVHVRKPGAPGPQVGPDAAGG